MGRFEKQALEGAKTKPHVWWRYLDNIFMIWTGNEDELREFIEHLNNLHPKIKFTSEQSSHSVAFLDTTISIKDGKISTDLFVKPTDTHQSCSSAHLATHIIQKDPSPTVLDYTSAAFVQMTPHLTNAVMNLPNT